MAHGVPRSLGWVSAYIRRTVFADGACALAAGLLAFEVRFGARDDHQQGAYLIFSCALPLLWCAAVAFAGGYDSRIIGLGSDEFRRVLNGAVGLTAGLAIFSYAARLEIAREYVGIALPSALLFDLFTRFLLRKRLHRLRRAGQCTQRVVAVGHAPAVADLVALLRRDSHHGLAVVGACLAGGTMHRLRGIAAAPDRMRLPLHQLLISSHFCENSSATSERSLSNPLRRLWSSSCMCIEGLDSVMPRSVIDSM